MPFSKLGLSDPIVNAISELGYIQPTEIQKQAIPIILSGKDLMASAQTGTGKTASFVLPLLEKMQSDDAVRNRSIHALILAPTRELAAQVASNIEQYAKYLNLSSLAIYGGTDLDPQKERLAQGVNVLVATPGRLLDLAYQRALFFDDLKFFVIDEADKMLDMGFIDDLYKILDRLPHQRQNLLFSATLTEDVRYLAADTVSDDVVEICVSPQNKTVAKIKQWLITVDKDTKSALLSHLINEQHWDQALIFVEKKHSAAKLVEQLGKRGIIADAIHSGRSQSMRDQVLSNFKSGKLKFLIATGIAARGVDIDSLSRVVNYDLPYPSEEYIHRIGRTGRAGAEGEAISLVSKDDFKNLCAIESLLGHLIERQEIEGFPVRKVVPISILNYR
ncbi:DEAD/DEAH box helicase [Hydrogenovibrio sp. SC-1]|uniref:DEAD/DEAH box helicase n=1 Tax=Hydrogenovibrio sp. SC-1 TaxID=2065820 RepID=UPI000C79E796|nr:DEAD/DEAH box helicase [Hydrogenovibrio sp. SC-1]PLA73449.1 DEAD/DEAH box helicase [Hydrogenovibrio sp. SC-1]